MSVPRFLVLVAALAVLVVGPMAQAGVWTQIQQVTGDVVNNSDDFGKALYMAGDYAVVGADDYNGKDGAIFIYHLSGGTWTQQASFLETAGNAYLGRAVGMSEDYAIAGAPQDASGGYAKLYSRSGTAWSYAQTLTGSDTAADDKFGQSVSVSGDYALVGAQLADLDGTADAGAAYIYHQSGGTWTQVQKLVAADAGPADFFGCSVVIKGDYAAIGAYSWDNAAGAQNEGAVYLYKIDANGTYNYQTTLTATSATASSSLGISVDMDGDYIISGSYQYDPPGGGHYAGGATIWHLGADGTWDELPRLTAFDGEDTPVAGDKFGTSVAVSGGYAVVGSPYFDADGTADTGAVYMYELSANGTWTFLEKLVPSEVNASDMFGWGVGVSGWYAFGGASGYDYTGQADQGAAFIFENSLIPEPTALLAVGAGIAAFVGVRKRRRLQ